MVEVSVLQTLWVQISLLSSEQSALGIQALLHYQKQGRRNRGARGAVPPNNLHKYAVLLITKVCHFKKNYVCPPQSVKKFMCAPPPQSVKGYLNDVRLFNNPI